MNNQLDRKDANPLVGIIMGSTSDWETMEHASNILTGLGIPHETRVVSAHRTPDLLFEYASSAEQRGLEAIIAGAGGAAHLPGMTASKTVLPVPDAAEIRRQGIAGGDRQRRRRTACLHARAGGLSARLAFSIPRSFPRSARRPHCPARHGGLYRSSRARKVLQWPGTRDLRI